VKPFRNVILPEPVQTCETEPGAGARVVIAADSSSFRSLRVAPYGQNKPGIRLGNLDDDFYRQQEDDGQTRNKDYLQARRSCKANRDGLVPIEYRPLFREQKTLQESGSEKSENFGITGVN